MATYIDTEAIARDVFAEIAKRFRVFSASLRNPGTKASSNSGFKDDER